MAHKDPVERAAYQRVYKLKIGNGPANVCKERTRRQALTLLGGACSYCGISDPIVLVFDHVNDDGAQERKSFYAGALPRLILKGKVPKERYQILCHNCNWRKEYLRRKDAE